MTQVLRFVIAVQADWTIVVDGPPGTTLPPPPPLWPPAGPPAAPVGVSGRDTFFYKVWDPATGPDIPALHSAIFDQRDYTAATAAQLGRFLFDRLLGDEGWQAICASAAAVADSIIELALRFDGARYELHRFPWELMHGPSGFLTQALPPASVTRLVSRLPAAGPLSAAPFSSPPRLLFAVGAGLSDRRIRPAVEIFGLLRQIQSRGLMVNTRALLKTSATALRETIAEFKPDLVHFSGHGDIEMDNGVARGYLEFQRDDRKDVVHRGAAELLGDLRSAGRIPPVVVLSACHSAVSPPAATAGPNVLAAAAGGPLSAGAESIGSLAAELVAGGVPVVVGMGGEVADSACRLFTRFFGESLVRGDPLIAAVARGRRAAFLDGVPDRADWAYPVLFLAADLDAAYAPAAHPAGQPHPCQLLAQRIQAYGVPRFPVFWGRHEFFDRYQQLFMPAAPQTLPIFARREGEGRTRLLQELAAQALRDGHLPCWVGKADPDWPNPPFTEVSGLAIEILRAIDNTRKVFGLPLPLNSSILGQVIAAKDPSDLAQRLSACQKRSEFLAIVQAADVTAGHGPSAEVCHAAIQEDLQALINEARAAVPPLAGPNSRVLMLFDEVHRYDDAIHPLLRTLIKGFGLGSLSEPVPVILSYRFGTPADALFTEASETIGARALELQRFNEQDDEDLMACGQVLLFPDEASPDASYYTERLLDKLKKKIEGKVASFAIRHGAEAKVKEIWSDQFRMAIEGSPLKLGGREFYQLAVGACLHGYLEFGDDEARLRKL